MSRVSVVRSKWSLSTLIPLLVLGSGIVLLFIYLSISYQYQKTQYRQLAEQRLESLGPHLTSVVQQFLPPDQNAWLAMELQALHELPDAGLVAIIDNTGTVQLASDVSLTGLHLADTELASAAQLIAGTEGAVHQVFSPIDEHQQLSGVFSYYSSDTDASNNAPVQGHVVVRLNLEKPYESLWATVWSQGLITAAILAAITSLLWWVLHRVVIVPLKRVVASARAISAGDFTVRPHLPPGNELGDISAALNSLALSCSEQAEVENMQKRLSLMVDDMVDELYINNAETYEFINTNKAARKNLGYSALELTNLKPWDFVVDHSKATFDEFLKPLFDGSKSHVDCESVHICKDGSLYPVRSRMQYMAHQTPPVLVTISRDLSELRNQEESARLRERAMEAVSEGIIITDAGKSKRTIVYVNDAISKLTGYSEDELLGSSIDMLRKNDLDQPGLRSIQRALHRGESVQVQLDATRKDGTAYVTDVSMSPVLSPSGEPTHYIGIHRDVTQRIETEGKLHQAQKIKAIGHLSGGLAHDFNNLLSVIVGNLELLRVGNDDKEQVARIEGAENAAHMGAHLTRRLLSFASQQRLVPVVTNVNDHVRNASALLAPTIGETISLTEELAPDLWNTLTDPGEIETAVINLAINARDAMPQGGNIIIQTANVDLDADGTNVQLDVQPGQYVRLCVMDNGPGISASMQDRIFEPFFTTKRDNEGSGLGLASVFGFAKQSGGCVNVSSAEGKGTTFSVYLPRHVETSNEPRINPRVDEKPCDCFHGVRILIVEDKEMVRQLTNHQLQALGFVTLEVDNGQKAISLLEAGVEVDVVLSDVVMPGGISGYDVAHWVQKQRPQCHILLTSGFSDPGDHTAKADVADLHVLQKPYRLDDLRKALHEVMNCTVE